MDSSKEKADAEHVDIVFDEDLKRDIVTETTGPQSKSHDERRLLWKQDLSLALPLAGCFFFAYLDRGQIGNARIMGLEEDLGLSNSMFYNCLLMFYIGYMVFELPATLSLRIVPPNCAFGGGVIGFGVLAICTAWSGGYAGLMVIRFLLGMLEAVVQSGFVYLSLWYTKEELASRTAFFYVSAPIAGAISGLISYGVDSDLDGRDGLHSWQWLFTIEGIMTVGWGIFVALIVPRLPETVVSNGSWLFHSQAERDLIKERTSRRDDHGAKPKLFQIWMALKDPKSWLSALVIGAMAVDIAAFGVFLPTFLHEFGWSRLNTQLFTIIPYGCAAVSTLSVTLLSDRIGKKALPLACLIVTCIIGFIILLATTNKGVLLFATCLVSIGSYPGIVLSAAFMLVNQGGYTKRSTTFAMAQVFMQCYSIISTQIYVKPPRYFLGHGVMVGFNIIALIAVGLLLWIMSTANRKRDAVAEKYATRGVDAPGSDKSLEELCDFHPTFRYVL